MKSCATAVVFSALILASFLALVNCIKCYDCDSRTLAGCGSGLTTNLVPGDCGSGVVSCLKIVNKTSTGTYYTRSCSPRERGLCNIQYCNTGSNTFEVYSCTGDSCNHSTSSYSLSFSFLAFTYLTLLLTKFIF